MDTRVGGQSLPTVGRGKMLRLYTQNPAVLCIFAGKLVRDAVRNAFLNPSAMGTTSPSTDPKVQLSRADSVPASTVGSSVFLGTWVVCTAAGFKSSSGPPP